TRGARSAPRRGAVDGAAWRVRAVRGTRASWFVLGSNDHYIPKPLNYFKYFVKRRKRRFARRGRGQDLIRGRTAHGWIDLTNARTLLDVDGVPIELLGLDDAHLRWHDLRVAPRTARDRLRGGGGHPAGPDAGGPGGGH